MTDLDFDLTYAGIPLLADDAFSIRRPGVGEQTGGLPDKIRSIRKHQPEETLLEELERLIPLHYLRDFAFPDFYTGKNLSDVAHPDVISQDPGPKVRIGDYYYPPTASRWSVFRGLASSTLVKKILAAVTPGSTATFVMQSDPTSNKGAASLYKVQTSLYLLPPRPLGEDAGSGLDGLYLITLVDERFYFQGNSVSLRPGRGVTWDDLLDDLASALGITLNYDATPAVYGSPDPDSQLLSSFENAAVLLDALAYNTGRVAVRNLDGTYNLRTYADSAAILTSGRGVATSVLRAAGGDLFSSGTKLPVGNLTRARNTVVPATVRVTFPKYVFGDDPVPHYLNDRYAPPRPTSWFEDSYGAQHSISVPVSSGGPLVSGLTGVGTLTIRDTAKALVSGEDTANLVLNNSGLSALSLQLARDHYEAQVAAALDEVYPGTKVLPLEGTHDILWTVASKRKGAFTRVMRAEWTRRIASFQHSVPPSGMGLSPAGHGGHSVALNVRDTTISGAFYTTLSAELASGSFTASLAGTVGFPTDQRWVGLIGTEKILFDGVGGDIVYRGIDGTVEQTHALGAAVTNLGTALGGINLISLGRMQFAYPAQWSSGGIQGVNILPQTQTILSLDASGPLVAGWHYHSGRVHSYEAGVGFVGREYAWVVERNNQPITSGRFYDGQFAGYPNGPAYLVNEYSGGGMASLLSGQIEWYNLAPDALSLNLSGNPAASGIVQWFNLASGAVYDNALSVFNWGLEFCWDLFYCCYNHEFATSQQAVWSLPSHKVVYNLTPYPSSYETSIYSIIPNYLVSGTASGSTYGDGQLIVLINVSSGTIKIFDHEEAIPQGGISGLTVLIPPGYGTRIDLAQRDSIMLWYDPCNTPHYWRVLGTTVCCPNSGTPFELATGGVDLTANAHTETNYRFMSGAPLTLPGSGKYQIIANVAGSLIVSGAAVAYITADLYDANTSGSLDLSENEVVDANQVDLEYFRNTTLVAIHSVTASNTIYIRAKHTATGVVVSGAGMILADGSLRGSTNLKYVKLGI